MAKRLITVNDILAGHVSLDVACLDRIYLNGYLPTVQVPGQVVQFLQHRGFPGARPGTTTHSFAIRSPPAGTAARRRLSPLTNGTCARRGT
jgi:hypothetical protein